MELLNKPNTSDNKYKSNATKHLSRVENMRAKSKPVINRTQGEENIFSLINNKQHNMNVKIHNTEEEKYDYHSQRQPIKGHTPKANEFNKLKLKINKNHIKDNRLAVINNEAPLKLTKTKEESKSEIVHKDFGKTPE
jgi:hypothetical protein